jgi:hypothetical protein
MTSGSDIVNALSLLGLCLLIYFLPALIANRREHPQQAAIFVLDLLLGWTFVGWVAALVWALIKETPPTSPEPQPVRRSDAPVEATKTCPQCAETLKAEAKICRFCRYEFPLESSPATHGG